MDGVTTGFVEGVAELFNTSLEGYSHWNVVDFLVAKKLLPSENPEDEFWKIIDAQGWQWWAGLSKLPWADELIDFCQHKADEVHFATSPSRHPNCAKGKAEWVKTHRPDMIRNIIMTPNKELLSRKGTLLLDDSQYKVDKFNMKGEGFAFVFPRQWNGNAYDLRKVYKIIQEYFNDYALN